MTQINFDVSNIPPSETLDPIPTGWYPAVMDESDIKPTRDASSGNLLFHGRFTIIDGPHRGRKMFARHNWRNSNPTAQQIGQREISALGHACGVLYISDTQQLHNIPIQIRVKLRPAEGQYDASNEVAGYRPINAAQPQPGAPAAFPGQPPATTGFPGVQPTFPGAAPAAAPFATTGYAGYATPAAAPAAAPPAYPAVPTGYPPAPAVAQPAQAQPGYPPAGYPPAAQDPAFANWAASAVPAPVQAAQQPPQQPQFTAPAAMPAQPWQQPGAPVGAAAGGMPPPAGAPGGALPPWMQQPGAPAAQ